MLQADIEKAIRDLREYGITVYAKDGELVIPATPHPPDYVSGAAQRLLNRHAAEAVRYLEGGMGGGGNT